MKKSKKYELNKEDLVKIGKGAGIALAGCLLTYLTEIIGDVDFGEFTSMVTALWSVVVNFVSKFLKDNSK